MSAETGSDSSDETESHQKGEDQSGPEGPPTQARDGVKGSPFVWDFTFNRSAFNRGILKGLAGQSAEDLLGDVRRDVSEKGLVDSATPAEDSNYAQQIAQAGAEAEKIKNQILGAERDRLEQQKKQRRVFFYWAIAAITGILIFNSVIFVWHMDATRGRPSDTVIISWITTSIVEVIGLGYIIARSLFKLENSQPANGAKADASSRITE